MLAIGVLAGPQYLVLSIQRAAGSGLLVLTQGRYCTIRHSLFLPGICLLEDYGAKHDSSSNMLLEALGGAWQRTKSRSYAEPIQA